jgi:hypothetical protein
MVVGKAFFPSRFIESNRNCICISNLGGAQCKSMVVRKNISNIFRYSNILLIIIITIRYFKYCRSSISLRLTRTGGVELITEDVDYYFWDWMCCHLVVAGEVQFVVVVVWV